MSLTGTMSLFRVGRCSNLINVTHGFHTSSITYLNQDWRQKKGWVANPNSQGPLVTLPDFSYKDNRPSPYGANQMKRIRKHQEYAKKVIQLVSEVDYAVAKHAKLLKEEEERKQKILESKLKPKGQNLLN